MNELSNQQKIDQMVTALQPKFTILRFDGPLKEQFYFRTDFHEFISGNSKKIAESKYFDVSIEGSCQSSSLWRTDFGAYFLVGEGGDKTPFASPLKRYASPCGHACVPLSPAAAQLWLNLNGLYAKSTEVFGDWDGKNSPGLNFLIKPDLLFDLKILAKKYDQPVEKFIMDLLVERTQYSLLNLVRWIFKRKN